MRTFLKVHLSVSENNEVITFSNLSTGSRDRDNDFVQCFHSFHPKIKSTSVQTPSPNALKQNFIYTLKTSSKFSSCTCLSILSWSHQILFYSSLFSLTLFSEVIKIFRIHIDKFYIIYTISNTPKNRIIANYLIRFGHGQFLLEFGLFGKS